VPYAHRQLEAALRGRHRHEAERMVGEVQRDVGEEDEAGGESQVAAAAQA
jgi:hypothetical protein